MRLLGVLVLLWMACVTGCLWIIRWWIRDLRTRVSTLEIAEGVSTAHSISGVPNMNRLPWKLRAGNWWERVRAWFGKWWR